MSWYYFPPSRPIPVEDGIRVRSRRGTFGATWWGKRWIQVLEGFGWSARLQRGRSYARKGQVRDFRLASGKVLATVQGSRPRPYRVSISLSPLPEPAWRKVVERLGSRAAFTAQLLDGEMPTDIEEVFREAGLPLFPDSDRGFRAECNCPDWANPCKHIAAVHYVLSEAFDRDPFLLFSLRGKGREELLGALRKARAGPPEGHALSSRSAPSTTGPHRVPQAPSPGPTDFWGSGSEPAVENLPSPAPRVPYALLRTLGTPTVLRGRKDLQTALEEAYATVSAKALGPTSPPPKRATGRKPA